MTMIAHPSEMSGTPAAPGRRRVVLITGISGAGLSTALRALEDHGYEAVDNLPLSLLEALIRQGDDDDRATAVVLDTRTRDFSAARLLEQFDLLRQQQNLQVELVFLDCNDDVLQRRFTETRRRHPLAKDRPIADGIQHERTLLAPVRSRADMIVDTSILSGHELRRLLSTRFQPATDGGLNVLVTSFAFRNGVPREADLVFDVRFLENPHYDPGLRPLTGQSPEVAARIRQDADYGGFFANLTALLEPLLPRYASEGKSYLTIAFGCTGGKHRSVFVSEQFTDWLRTRGYRVSMLHRELNLESGPA